MKLDTEVVKFFKEWQKDENKYLDFDIESVDFKLINLSDEKYFEFIKGKNKYIQKYIINNLGNYPILGSSLKNNCISNYIKPIDESDLVTQKCISFNKDNAKGSKPFYRDKPFLMDRHHIAIIPSDEISAKFLEKSLIHYFYINNFGWGDNVASVDEVQKHSIYMPNPITNFEALEIQQILVEFLDFWRITLSNFKDILKPMLSQIDHMEDVMMSKIFQNKKDTFLTDKFNMWLLHGQGEDEPITSIKFEDIEFENQKIISKNEDKVICNKKMGFTPKRDEDGDINWFTVADLTKQKGLYINEPNTKEKTTMKLIKEKVDSKNTGKSEKLISIKKGDVLVSFKLTVGCTKIYNSDKLAYCNEAIDILTLKDGYDSKYIALNCEIEYPKYGIKTNNGYTLNDDEKAKIIIPIPKPINTEKSLKIQKLLVRYIGEHKNWNKEMKAIDTKMGRLTDSMQELFLAKTFRNNV